MSTDREDLPRSRWAEGWGRVRIRRAPARRQAPDATAIARNLTEKYGAAALSLARDRAARAIEVGDDLALDAWHAVIAATKRLLRQSNRSQTDADALSRGAPSL